MNKRGQTRGLVTGLIFGIVALVIAVIISFVIVSTLNNSDLLSTSRVTTTALNEVGWINTTTYTLTNVNANTLNFAITGAVNRTSGLTILAGNYSLSALGVVANASTIAWNNVSFNYTYQTYLAEELAQNRMIGNFTSGVDNVSSKIPTALLVAAIVLILAILGVLVGVWSKMRMGGGI